MFTLNYKGIHIHGYTDKSECRVQFVDTFGRTVKSLHAAKLYITKYLKQYPRTQLFT